MFDKSVYIERRTKLKKDMGKGIIILLGNMPCPVNYRDNTYPFRQDSSFLYFFGIDQPNLIGVIDIDNDSDLLFADEPNDEEMIWFGSKESLSNLALKSGVNSFNPINRLYKFINSAVKQKRTIHYLPQYRADNILTIENLLGIKNRYVNKYASVSLIKAVVKQRLKKADCEINEIKDAVKISEKMYEIAFDSIKPGIYEQEVVGKIEGYTTSMGYRQSFPTILTKDGHILHNLSHKNRLKAEDMVILDSGVESHMHYASDITRTIPVDTEFSEIQKEIYNIVLKAQTSSINMLKAGVYFYDVHLNAARTIACGLVDMGIMKGNCDDIVELGAYALFFLHGIGHPIGLDVHDMESLGEDLVGYDETVSRSKKLGLSGLRFARKLEDGYVMSVEPGVYFIPNLIEKWKNENRFKDFINYEKAAKLCGVGGVRIEDDILVTADGCEILSSQIPKTYSFL